MLIVAWSRTPASVDEVCCGVPSVFQLYQNYPNLFNATTTIKFSVGSASGRRGEPARVTLKVYDVLGREVVTLVDERKQPGVYALTWDAGNVPSGVYSFVSQRGRSAKLEKR
jgi:hypothetical protein